MSLKYKKLDFNKIKLIENFFSLVVLNIVNYVFPIIIIPILINRLGVESYGMYIFSFTILNYLNLIVQYGFNFSSTNKIAKNQDKKLIIENVYTSVTIIRLVFSIVLTLIILLIGLFVGDKILLNLLGIGIFFGQGLIPIWLFQGLEKMKYLTIVNTIVRVLSFILILIFINDSSDMNLLMGIQSISFIIGAILSFFLVRYELKFRFVKPTLISLKENLQEGWSLFLSTIGMNLYRESGVVLLGLISGYTTVGLYSPAEKLVKGVQSFANISVTALYPYFSKSMEVNGEESIKNFMKVGKLLGIAFFSLTILLILGSSYIIHMYLGKKIATTILDFRILSFVIFFGGLNYYYGIVGLVNFGKEKLFNKLVWVSGGIGIVLCIILSFLLKDVGTAIAMVLAEALMLLLIIFKSKHLWR